MKAESATLRFEPVAAQHFPLLRRWLEMPHVREWWGEPEKELGHIRDMVAGRDTTQPFLIVLDEEPVGYIQCWFIGHHQNKEWVDDNPWLMELPAETVGVDLSIGDPEKLSKGIGTAALGAFVRKLLNEGHTTIIIDPDPQNTRAVRAYTKAGFRPIPHLAGRTQGSLIMQYQTHAHETTI
ncbi:GNAT family N-acetyltransferase [Chelativorans alearense]|uniref:GNAT family N-acetyltransferase n=1 Tax=Chelativorans alearense TaxID=2681495 RepID=UPI0013D3EA8D|nr:GNAT family N-acetyltransferase [Chelativorans alearense]